MKKIIFTWVLSLLGMGFSFGQNKNFIDQPYIEVTGFADTLLIPNEIFIRILISEKDTKDKVSIEEQEKKLIETLKSIRIDTEKDLSASDMMSQFNYYLLKQKDIIKQKEYILKVQDANTAGNVFFSLEKIDVSNASIQRVSHSEIEKIMDICRTNAIKNAQKRAKMLASGISQSIGNAIFISDFETGVEPLAYQNTMQVRTKFSSTANDSYENSNLNFEKIKIQSNLRVNFILK